MTKFKNGLIATATYHLRMVLCEKGDASSIQASLFIVPSQPTLRRPVLTVIYVADGAEILDPTPNARI